MSFCNKGKKSIKQEDAKYDKIIKKKKEKSLLMQKNKEINGRNT